MPNKQSMRWHFLLMAGLLILSLGSILRRTLPRMLPLADPVNGFVVGIGIGCMLLALIAAKKQPLTNCSTCPRSR